MKKAKKENKQRQGISLKYKGMLLTAMLIFVVVGATLMLAIPQIKSNMTETIHSYMYDIAERKPINGRSMAKKYRRTRKKISFLRTPKLTFLSFPHLRKKT